MLCGESREPAERFLESFQTARVRSKRPASRTVTICLSICYRE